MSNQIVWAAIINGGFGLVVAGLTWWTGWAMKAIQHSVNSARDAMIAKAESQEQRITELESTIKKLLVERAAGAILDPVTLAELQTPKPIETTFEG